MEEEDEQTLDSLEDPEENKEASPQITPSLDNGKTWEDFGLDERLLRAIQDQKWTSPTLVQSAAIPLALAGKDILAQARTGSGKTASYCIPIIQLLLLHKDREEVANRSQSDIYLYVLERNTTVSESIDFSTNQRTMFASL